MKVPALTREQMEEVDRLMVDFYHIDLPQMMENAGRNLAALSRELFLGGDVIGKRVSVLAGSGGNGGGGLVAARHLHNWGGDVRVYLAKSESKFREVPGHQLTILKEMQVPIFLECEPDSLVGSDLVIDAIIGYSLRGTPRGTAAQMIKIANASKEIGTPVLSLDVPSGLDASTGEVFQPCISASATMTLALPKTGLLKKNAKSQVGALYLADISVPRTLYMQLNLDIPEIFSRQSIVYLD